MSTHDARTGSPASAGSPGATSPAALEGLTVRYGRTLALDRVSLAVPQRSVYALLGRNGAGKSSAVRCLLGQQRPRGGRALLFGEDAWRSRARAMARTGVVPEEPDMPPEMTAAELSRFSAGLYPSWDAAGVAARLQRFGVHAGVRCGSLSKGQKGQVMLALALGHRPDLLVLDDPTLGLDVVARREVFEELVSDLADRGTTVFLTTHDLAGIEGIAERVGILREGRLAVDEPLEALKARYRRIRHGGAGPRDLAPLAVAGRRALGWGFEAVVTNFDEAAFARVRAAAIADGEAEAMSLEEIFTSIAGEPVAGAGAPAGAAALAPKEA